jgi:iron complex outermembrane receptor protein
MTLSTLGTRKRLIAFSLSLLVLFITSALHAQTTSSKLEGTVTDVQGKILVGASVTLQDTEGNAVKRALTDAQGGYSFTNIANGHYNLAVSATGFSTTQRAITVAGNEQKIEFKLTVASVAEEVIVESEDNSSLAVQSAPVKALLDAGSARTEISSNYIAEYTSPVTDFADIIQAAPGTVSYTTNGIGNGQAKIFFRGFVDDDYTMTWDGVPFNDSNDPSHHSWAYVPAAAIGYVDFDRSPGTASDVGPSNFGGSIHFFSPHLSDQPHIRIQGTYGSWNTYQILGDINSGAFLNGKAHFWLNSDYQSSDGYQTNSPKQDVAATAKFDYKFSDRTSLTVIGSNIILDAFNNNDPTRRQYLHHGDNYLYDANQLNANGIFVSSAYPNITSSTVTNNAQFWRYSVYHVPSFFDIITLDHDFGKGWKLDSKSYTYGYSNHQHYQNKTDQDLVTDSLLTQTVLEPVCGDDASTPDPCTLFTSSKGKTPAPTGVDKSNQYARGGEIAALSYATKWGVLRVGNWYEYTNTTRYQIYTDPITWVDSAFISNIKFHEHFYTYTSQPYAEFQLVAIPRWTITAGVKDAYFLMSLTQWADGKTIGALGCPTGSTPASCTNTVHHSQDYNSILPSFEANYRINNNWSAYGQYGRGTIAPFSSVFDTTGAQVAVTPPPTIADTYQGGTVVKLNRLAFDADAYHIHFTNTYSTYTPSSGPDSGFTYYYANPDSNTNGFEAEGNVAVTHSLSFNANGTFGIAKYESAAAKAAVYDSTGTSILTPATPATPVAWVASAPHDTESIGMTYREKGLDFGIFGKRVGSRWADISNYHQTIPEDPFWMSNVFVNYSVHGNSIFAGSKIKLSVNNIFDDHSNVAISAANDGTTLASPYTVTSSNVVTQSLQLYSPSWADTLQKQAGRAVMISFQLGLSPKKR